MRSRFIVYLLWLLGCCCTGPCCIFAQPYHDNIWIFSDLNGASIADFSSGTVEVGSIDTDLMMAGGSAMICDKAGDLAFYTNGCRIYNWQHRLMENGEGLNPGEVYREYCNPNDEIPRGYPNAPQSTVTIPRPHDADKYYLLHLSPFFNYDTLLPHFALTDELFLTTVDMSQNDGEGLVTEKNHVVDSILREPKMILNRHANGEDWWLVNPLLESNEFNVYLVDSSGVHFQQRQSIGLRDSSINVAADQLVFTPNGKQLLRFSTQQGLRLFDFDRVTGALSNFRLIPFPQGSPREVRFGSVAVSPSGQYAYVNNETEVYQYDLWSDNIGSSQLLIAELFDDGSMLFPATVQVMQLGPDCKIYAYMVNGNQHHVIHNPDERGDACGWEQGGMQLGRYVFRDQPTFPNFRLGPLGEEGAVCAEPIVSTGSFPQQEDDLVSVYPNPAVETVAFKVKGAVGVDELTLMDSMGRILKVTRTALVGGDTGQLSLMGVPLGPYLLRLKLRDGRVVVKKLVVGE